MNSLILTKQNKILFYFRMFLQVIFLSYLIYKGEPFDVFAAFLIAIIAAEGYKILGTIASNQIPRNREMVGIVIGVLNGIIYMITVYLTGYIKTELWVFAWLSTVITAIEFGMYGGIAEGIIMSTLYIVIGAISGIDLPIILVRAFALVASSIVVGIRMGQAIVCEFRFNEIKKRAELTKEQRTRFIGVISHSLRTPLTTVRGYVDLLKNERAGKLKKEQKELIEKLTNEVDELHGLVEDFLSLSILESGAIQITKKDFGLPELCKEAFEELKPLARNKDLEYEFQSDIKKLMFNGDRGKLENAIKNLIENAIKFTPQKGKVSLQLYERADSAIIEVKDSGIGIPKEDQEDLFTLFKRGTNVLKYDYKGTGLGLYMAKLIVETHYGRIEFVSEEGVGSTFKIILPIGRLGEVIRKMIK